MLYPPSLSAEMLQRAFRAPNGELGLSRSDVQAFLAVCEADGTEVYGWELWIVDHVCQPDSDQPLPENGAIWGCVPAWASIQGDPSSFFGGDGNLQQTSLEIAHLRLESQIKPRWLDHVRFNFTLAP